MTGQRRREIRLVSDHVRGRLSTAFAECFGCGWRWRPEMPNNPEVEATDHTRRTRHATIARWSEKKK